MSEHKQLARRLQAFEALLNDSMRVDIMPSHSMALFDPRGFCWIICIIIIRFFITYRFQYDCMKTKRYTTFYLRKVFSTNFPMRAFQFYLVMPLCSLFSAFFNILLQPPPFTTTTTYLSTFRRYGEQCPFFLQNVAWKIQTKGVYITRHWRFFLKIIYLFIWEIWEGDGKEENWLKAMWVWERVRRGILLCFYEKDPFYLCKSNSRKTKKKKIFRRVGGIFGQNDDGMPRGKKRKKEEERKKKT